eukprot:SAG22_NODE_1781_length_3596_cov_13.907921_3_plen_815_part_00
MKMGFLCASRQRLLVRRTWCAFASAVQALKSESLIGECEDYQGALELIGDQLKDATQTVGKLSAEIGVMAQENEGLHVSINVIHYKTALAESNRDEWAAEVESMHHSRLWQEEVLVHQSALRRERRMLRCLLMDWASWVQMKQAWATVFGHGTRQLQIVRLMSVVARWRGWVVRKQQHRSVVAKAVVRMRQTVAWRALCGWHDRAAVLQQQRLQLARVAVRMQMLCIGLAWNSWMCALEEGRTARVTLAHDTQIAIIRDEWAAEVDDLLTSAGDNRLQQEEVLVHQMVSRRERLTLLHLLLEWTTWAQEQLAWKAMLEHSVRRILNVRVSAAFSGWQIWASKAKHDRGVMRKFAYRMCCAVLWKAFGWWWEHAGEAKQQRVCVRRAIMRMQMVGVASAFSRWLNAVADGRAARLASAHTESIQTVCDEWAAEVESMHHSRLRQEEVLVHQSALRRERRMLRCLLMDWASWVQMKQAWATVFGHGTRQLQIVRLMSVVARWRGWVVRKQQHRSVVAKAVVRMRQTVAWRALCGWHDRTLAKKSSRVRMVHVLLRMDLVRGVQAWGRWQSVVVEGRAFRAAELSTGRLKSAELQRVRISAELSRRAMELQLLHRKWLAAFTLRVRARQVKDTFGIWQNAVAANIALRIQRAASEPQSIGRLRAVRRCGLHANPEPSASEVGSLPAGTVIDALATHIDQATERVFVKCQQGWVAMWSAEHGTALEAVTDNEPLPPPPPPPPPPSLALVAQPQPSPAGVHATSSPPGPQDLRARFLQHIAGDELNLHATASTVDPRPAEVFFSPRNAPVHPEPGGGGE